MAKFCGAVKQCVVCSREFKVPACRAETAICCSRGCKDAWWRTQRRKTVPLICEGCGEKFSEYASHADRRVFCSVACKSKHEVRPDISGDKNPMWKGGETFHSMGYVYIKCRAHPFSSHGNYVFEHRLVMETWLRENDPESKFLVEFDGEKYLDPKIIVHHHNADRGDNRRSNLECMTKSAHMKHHQNDPESIKRKIATLQLRLASLEKEQEHGT